jgi:hypothetical protein
MSEMAIFRQLSEAEAHNRLTARVALATEALKMIRRAVLALLLVNISSFALSQAKKTHGPDCSGGWPPNMAFVHLKNAGLADNGSVDFSKTKTVRIASEEVGKDLWRQVYHVTFTTKAGGALDTIVVHDASSDECSTSGVEVFVVSKHLNPEGK